MVKCFMVDIREEKNVSDVNINDKIKIDTIKSNHNNRNYNNNNKDIYKHTLRIIINKYFDLPFDFIINKLADEGIEIRINK